MFNVTAGIPCPETATTPCLTSLLDNYRVILSVLSAVSITFGILELLGICTAVGVIKSSNMESNRPGFVYLVYYYIIYSFNGLVMDDEEE